MLNEFRFGSKWLLPALSVLVLLFAIPSQTQDEVPTGPSGSPADGFGLDRPNRREPRGPREDEHEGDADEELDGTNEPSLAVDPNNPLHVTVASAYQINVSTDGGLTFKPPVYAEVPPGWGSCGDSSLGYDSQGRLFWTYLGCRSGLNVLLAQCNPTTGAILPGYPVNVAAAIGYSETAANDKEWIAIDTYPGSPYRDRIYIVYTDVLLTSQVSITYSEDQGHTWRPFRLLSVNTEGFAWPPHVAVAPNGDVYVSYHAPRSTGIAGRVFLCRSSNGGVSYPQKTQPFVAGAADVTFNVQSAGNTSIPKTDFWLQGNAQAYVLPDPLVVGTIRVLATDDPDNNLGAGDASNIYLVTSTNHGVTFGAPVRIDDGPGTTFAVMATPAIDQHTGAMLVHWYDNRLGALNSRGNYLLDVFARWSTDGGVTWSASRRINDKPFDPDLNAPCRFDCNGGQKTLRIGEYNGAGIAGEVGFATWCGNAVYGYQETIFDRFTFDLYPPSITYCPSDTTVECASACGVPATELASWLESFTATDSYDPSLALTNDAPSCFPMGATTVTFTATDDAGHATSCTAIVRVEDTTPPAIDVVLNRDVLWPPNHQLSEICGEITAVDACDESPVAWLVSIDSNEPDNGRGDGNQSPDVADADTGTDDDCFSLRSERSGGGDGRRYTIVYAAEDDDGNVAYDTVCVRVPHDRRAVAFASDGFLGDGTGLEESATSFAIIIPSTTGMASAALDAGNVYLGNTGIVVRPVSHRTLDINADGLLDLALYFATTVELTAALAPLMPLDDGVLADDGTEQTDGPVGIHFVSVSGADYLVPNIFALGSPWVMPSLTTTTSSSPPAAKAVSTGLSSISPNPFNPETSIGFHLASAENVRIMIYDVRGALVRRVMSGALPGGDHVARWNGLDDAGRMSSSGIYFVRLTAGSYAQTQKIVMLK